MNATTSNNTVRVAVYPPERQGAGSFDGGRITEIKPIGFPHERTEVRPVGPLFYWAWASARGDGLIGMHPHRGYEIVSYALRGEIGHRDTLGNASRVKAGGAQAMRTGSGVSHEERMFGERTDFFQIWFEPDLAEALKHPATYQEIAPEDFPVREAGGVRLKQVIGGDSPLELETDAAMFDVEIAPGAEWRHEIAPGRALAAMTVEGSGFWLDGGPGAKAFAVRARDFALLRADLGGEAVARAGADEPLHVVAVEVPLAK